MDSGPALYSTRGTTPSRVPRPRPTSSTAVTPAFADSPVRTVSLPSDRDLTKPILERLSYGSRRVLVTRRLHIQGHMPSVTLTTEMRFAGSVARYSHDDRKQEQHAEPPCDAMIRCVSTGHPSVLPSDFLACYLSLKRPSLSALKELAGKGRLHTTDDDIVLLVRTPTLPPTRSDKSNSVGRAACLLNDKPVRIYVPLLVRP